MVLCAAPIIASGDVIGVVGLLTEDRTAVPDAAQLKAVNVAAAFLARQMEEKGGTILNARRAALDELWHPAAATALERALHPAGHGPNSSSLLRPQAAVVAVAYSAEKLFIIE